MYNATWRLCFSYSRYLISIINIHVETSLAVYFWHYYDRVAFLKQFCLQTTKIHTVRLIHKKNFYSSLYTVITSTASAYCYRRNNVICWSVCLLQSWVLPKRLFGIRTRVAPKKHTLDGVRIGATWQIRLNSPCAAAMRPYVKLRWPLVTGWIPFLPPNQHNQSTEILHVQINIHCKLSIEQHFQTGHAKDKFSPVNNAPDVPGQKMISESIQCIG